MSETSKGFRSRRSRRWLPGVCVAWLVSLPALAAVAPAVELGARPGYLVGDMDPGPLRDTLAACAAGPFQPSRFSIGHRGAPLGYPEHTRESYIAAARQGAGVIECDVTFTRDGERVCRHSQCDLHSTTNILATGLAERCREPFRPADPDTGAVASARCCTSDLTLAEFGTLCGRRDRVNPQATSVTEYLAADDAAPPAGLSAPAGAASGSVAPPPAEACGTLMSHRQSIELFAGLGVMMMPELKALEVPGSFPAADGPSAFARSLLDDYRRAGIDPVRVWPQSFDLEVLGYWAENYPEFADQLVYLDGRWTPEAPPPADPAGYLPSMAELAGRGVRTVAPPLWVLLSLDESGAIVPSAYARAARAAGLDILTWTLERSGSLDFGGGYYFASIAGVIDNDGDVYRVLDVLARQVGARGVFSDWPATTTYYANCLGLQ